MVVTPVVHRAEAVARPALLSAHERRHLVLALLPDPNVFGVVPAAAVLIDGQLLPSAQASAVLPAPRLSLKPRGVVKTAAHALG